MQQTGSLHTRIFGRYPGIKSVIITARPSAGRMQTVIFLGSKANPVKASARRAEEHGPTPCRSMTAMKTGTSLSLGSRTKRLPNMCVRC